MKLDFLSRLTVTGRCDLLSTFRMTIGWFFLPALAPLPTAEGEIQARRILQLAGVQGGLIVHVGCDRGRLTAELRRSDRYVVHGLDSDRDDIVLARQHIRLHKLSGSVSVAHWTGGSLPYVDNLVNLLVISKSTKVDRKEAMRVLAPLGVACVEQPDGSWKKLAKHWPNDIDDWPMALYEAGGNAVSKDLKAGPPKGLQWTADPKWTRHHESMSSFHAMVSAGGRIFFINDEGPQVSLFLPPAWQLVCRDAFNGKELWRKPLGKWVSPLMNLFRFLFSFLRKCWISRGMSSLLCRSAGTSIWTTLIL